MQEEIEVKTEEISEKTKPEKKKKKKKEKKQIPKKEKIFKGFWIFFAVLLVLLYGLRIGVPLALGSSNPKVLKGVVTVAVKLMDDTIEYKTDDGETHKYYLTVDYSYFDLKDGQPPIPTPLIIEREEKDGKRVELSSEDVIADDKVFGDEKTAVLMNFINTATKKFGFDLVKEYYSGDDSKDKFTLQKGQRVVTDVTIFYTIFFIIFSILTYYQIWSRHYDEKLEQEKFVQELNKEYQKGVSKEQASVKQTPKKLTKKQKRELNKNNRS